VSPVFWKQLFSRNNEQAHQESRQKIRLSMPIRSTTTTTLLLNWRAFHCSKRTIDAAVARIGAQDFFTLAALIKILAGIGGHGFQLAETAVRAG
jgi:hypothetical protein